jgi:hypothetical protein
LWQIALIDPVHGPENEEAGKAKLDINPLSGEESQLTITEIFKLNTAPIDKLKAILK